MGGNEGERGEGKGTHLVLGQTAPSGEGDTADVARKRVLHGTYQLGPPGHERRRRRRGVGVGVFFWEAVSGQQRVGGESGECRLDGERLPGGGASVVDVHRRVGASHGGLLGEERMEKGWDEAGSGKGRGVVVGNVEKLRGTAREGWVEAWNDIRTQPVKGRGKVCSRELAGRKPLEERGREKESPGELRRYRPEERS